MRHWLLTWRTYGTWLPGDERGFVGKHRSGIGQVIHNAPNTAKDGHLSLLQGHAASLLKSAPVELCLEQATVLKEQFLETATHRGWAIHAGAILVNHVHLVLSAPRLSEPERLLQDMKAYGSRALSRRWRSAAWWASGGSKRHVLDQNLPAAVSYVLQQKHPLMTWR